MPKNCSIPGCTSRGNKESNCSIPGCTSRGNKESNCSNPGCTSRGNKESNCSIPSCTSRGNKACLLFSASIHDLLHQWLVSIKKPITVSICSLHFERGKKTPEHPLQIPTIFPSLVPGRGCLGTRLYNFPWGKPLIQSPYQKRQPLPTTAKKQKLEDALVNVVQ